MTEKAGLFRTGYAYGVTVGDYNNDGFEDLFITYWGQNVLYRNNGDGTFTDVTKEAGLLSAGGSLRLRLRFVDYDRDGRLDLFVSNYLTFDMESIPRPNQTGACNYLEVPVNCGPRGLPYGAHSAVPQQWRWNVYRCHRAVRNRQGGRRVRAYRGGGGL